MPAEQIVDKIWLAFIAALGACVGSFLNVVIYRLPREKSLVRPRSACPKCNTPIAFYDNIPIVSWLALRAKCRHCKAPISARYVLIELFTLVVFVGVYVWVFMYQGRQTGIAGATAFERFFNGGWLIYVPMVSLAAGFLAASAIDLELWIIPIQICWFIALVGLLFAAAAGWILPKDIIFSYDIYKPVLPVWSAASVGAAVGWVAAWALTRFGLIPISYILDEDYERKKAQNPQTPEPEYCHRLEMLKEIAFLLPIGIGAGLAAWLSKTPPLSEMWTDIALNPKYGCLLSSLCGYFVGCGVVWATRIFGTLAFGKEAMGLGDVHLMGAAGAVIGAVDVTIAFFVAPFLGIAWAAYQAIFKKIRQIPYGPFLSAAVFAVMMFHDTIKRIITEWYGF